MIVNQWWDTFRSCSSDNSASFPAPSERLSKTPVCHEKALMISICCNVVGHGTETSRQNSHNAVQVHERSYWERHSQNTQCLVENIRSVSPSKLWSLTWAAVPFWIAYFFYNIADLLYVVKKIFALKFKYIHDTENADCMMSCPALLGIDVSDASVYITTWVQGDPDGLLYLLHADYCEADAKPVKIGLFLG